MELEIAVGVAILIALVFLATVDMAFSHLSDLGLRRLSSDTEGSAKADFLRDILANRPRFRFALSSAIQFLLITFTVIVTMVVLRWTSNRTQLIFFALLIGLVATVIFRQILPRLIVRSNAESILLFLLPIVRPIYSLASFLVRPVESYFRTKDQQKLEATVIPDSAEEKDEADEDFQALLEVGEAEGIIEEEEREMIESMVEFAETRVGEIMTPRTEICAISIDSTVGSARNLIIEEKYSRLPVYREKVDNVEGIIYVRDLLQVWAEGGKEDQPIEPLLRDAYFVPETKTAAELLKSMQVNHVQIAIVIDEYGGVAGIVTVEDLLEEIVGEIEDEDTEQEEIIEIIEGEDGYFDVLGSTEIDKIERLWNVDLEDEEYTTIAGLVTTEAGYVPKEREKLQLRGLDIEILKADEKKVYLLRLRPAESQNDGVSSVENQQ